MERGLAVSPGIGIGKAYIISEPDIIIDKGPISVDNVPAELERLRRALESSGRQLRDIYDSAVKRGEKEKAEIIEAHLMMLEDPMLAEQAEEKAHSLGVKAEYAFWLAVEEQVSVFEGIEDAYIRERVSDIRDIGSRVLKNLAGVVMKDISAIDEEVILVGKEITPSQMAAADTRFVMGIASETGGSTSHTAIMARNAGIPAVMGVRDISGLVREGQLLAVDGTTGAVELEPDEDRLAHLKMKITKARKLQEELAGMKDSATVTLDGKAARLECNIEGTGGIKKAREAGAEGIGLYRTEFLFMDRSSMPDEEEQFNAYREAAAGMDGRPVIIRTLDIGGDKEIGYLKLPKEENPFLGFRAIRLCFERQEMFRTQLRAILRASAYGRLKIMFPMIATLGELRRAKALLEEAKRELELQGGSYDKDIETGIMIEIPSAAIISDQLARESDFFSIGTNDLTQYTLAVDRTNGKVSYLYNCFEPAVIRLIRTAVEAGHKRGIPVGMCGELAGDPKAALLLLGLGLDELSMSPGMVLRIRKLISSVEMSTAVEIAERASEMEASRQIEDYLAAKYRELGLEYLLEI